MLFLISTTKTSHNCHMLKRSLFQEHLKICGNCKKCVMWRVRFISLIKMWSHPSSLSSSSTTLYCVLFSCPWAFFKGTPFFYMNRIYVVSRMSAWVTFFSTWSVEWPSKKSGTNWQRTQPTPARNSPFFYSPNLKSCQTSDFLDYIKLYARSKRTQPTPARKSPFFLYSPNLSVFWIILYQTRCQVKADATKSCT